MGWTCGDIPTGRPLTTMNGCSAIGRPLVSSPLIGRPRNAPSNRVADGLVKSPGPMEACNKRKLKTKLTFRTRIDAIPILLKTTVPGSHGVRHRYRLFLILASWCAASEVLILTRTDEEPPAQGRRFTRGALLLPPKWSSRRQGATRGGPCSWGPNTPLGPPPSRWKQADCATRRIQACQPPPEQSAKASRPSLLCPEGVLGPAACSRLLVVPSGWFLVLTASSSPLHACRGEPKEG
jgi:hypothetical protein